MNETSHIDDKGACSAAVKPQSVVRSIFNRSIRERRIPLVLSLMVISLGLWIVCAKLAVPPVIESAYRGESWSFLNRMIQGQATHPVSEYLQDWNAITIPVLLEGLGFWLVVLVISSPRFSSLLRAIPIQCLGLAAFFWVYHKLLVYSIRTVPLSLGDVTPHHDAAPLYADSEINLNLWIIPAIIVLTGFLLLCRRLFLERTLPRAGLFAISIVAFLLIGLSVAMIDGYRWVNGQRLPAFLEPYSRTKLEYYGDVPKVQQLGVRPILRDYAKPELFSTLSEHSRTHPPGGILFLWLVSQGFGYNLLSASLASITLTSLAVIPMYLLAKTLYGESVGRYALPLFLLMPNFVMFATTSMDGPFSVFPILSGYLFYKALQGETVVKDSRSIFVEQQTNTSLPLYAILTGIALGLGMFMTYSTVFMGVCFTVITVVTWFADRERFKLALTTLVIAGATFVAFYLLMFWLTGFNLLEALWASIRKANAEVPRYETIGRYYYVGVANLFAFLIGCGIPMTTIWIQQVLINIRRAREGKGIDIYLMGYLISLLGFAFSTLYTMEVERQWIFMAPFIVIPVAKFLHDRCESQRSVSAFYWVAGLSCLQLIAFEATLDTWW